MSKKTASLASTEKETDRLFVTALSRGLDILRCFDRPGVELGVSEIARRVALNQATTWRLCYTLLARGFLVRSLHGQRLRIGAPALTLGYAAIGGLGMKGLALPYMQQLTERFQGSTTLVFRQGLDMISVEQCDGDFILVNQPVGWRAPLSSVPSGLAVLAILAPDDRERTLAQLRALDPAAWERRRARIDRAAAQLATDGYVVLDSMADGVYAAVAIPLAESLPGAADPLGVGVGAGAAGGVSATRYWAISCGGLRTRWTPALLAQAGAGLVDLKSLLQPAIAVGR